MNITPTVGRVLHYWPVPGAGRSFVTGGEQPLACMITHVHSDDCVNLVVFDATGMPYPRQHVTLRQPEQSVVAGPYCEWMQYQVGQAEKLGDNVVSLDLGADALDPTPMEITDKDVDIIAEACHEANRDYCMSIGDYSQNPWAATTEDLRESSRSGVREALSNPEATAEQMHQSWMDHKLAAGWVYGPVKDAGLKTHPCLVPFSSLDPADQAKDTLFIETVRSTLDAIMTGDDAEDEGVA